MRTIRGFTLIEILVVIFIMGIVTSVALLSITRNENRQLETFTRELVQRLTLAEEQAMLQPSVLGFSIENNAYQFSRYYKMEKGKPSWLPVETQLQGNHLIPQNIEISLEISGKKISLDDNDMHTPCIVISTSGDITPFTIYIAKKGQTPRFKISGDVDGNITSQSLT